MNETNEVKGFKIFDYNWTCKPKQKIFKYKIGCTYEENVEPIVCRQGFHFCKRAIDCFNYRTFRPQNKVAEILALGKIATDGVKYCTNKIKIVREVSWNELLEIVNSGNDCTGLGNSGNCNSGDYNSGNHNSGNGNSSNYNSGSFNSNDYNSGHFNSGKHNSGHFNSGNYNVGCRNSGSFNSGNYNSGNYNNGNYNSGDWNNTNYSNGCFNTIEPKIYLFNKPSELTYSDWQSSKAYKLISQLENKASNAEHFIIWWKNLSDYEKEIIKEIPNFDNEIFKEITGIDISDTAIK